MGVAKRDAGVRNLPSTIRRTSSELIKGLKAASGDGKERAAEQAQEDIILLVSNTDRSEYDL